MCGVARLTRLTWLTIHPLHPSFADAEPAPASDEHLSDTGLRMLTALTGLQRLQLGKTLHAGDEALHDCLAAMPHLTNLQLPAAPNMTGLGVVAATSHGVLRHLDLAGSCCNNMTLDALASCSRLSWLRIGGGCREPQSVDGPVATADHDVWQLRRLAGGRRTCENLRSLSIVWALLSDLTLAAGVEALPQLRELSISTCPGVGGGWFGALRHCQQLVRLQLEDMHIGDDQELVHAVDAGALPALLQLILSDCRGHWSVSELRAACAARGFEVDLLLDTDSWAYSS